MKHVSIIGASGYTGVELVRLVSGHPDIRIRTLVAGQNAGKDYAELYPALRHLDLPALIGIGQYDAGDDDLVFCALPHGTSQEVILALNTLVRVVDLSADFRLRNPNDYLHWYGKTHIAPELQEEAVYGLTEFYRDSITGASLVACTGCNVATGLYPLLPLVQDDLVDTESIIIDIKTGVSGAGRSPRVQMLHAEMSEGCQAYNVERHRHMAEFDQELSRAAGRQVMVSFTPHLVPQNRGILATVYVNGDPIRIHAALEQYYEQESFILVLPFGAHPSTRDVRGSNYVHVGVVPDRMPGKAKLFCTLDNLVKGASGQALQNANLMLGLDEGAGLASQPLVP